MKKTILLILVALIVMSVPAMSARVVNKEIPHEPFCVYQAYCGLTCCDLEPGTAINGCSDNHVFLGLNGFGTDTITAVPGILAIDPGGTQPKNGWPNFVTASQPGGPPVGADGTTYWTVTNVSMRKTVPTYICTVGIGGAPVLQQGSANIRLWWPLMYELPGTKWTLTISYKTLVWNDGVPGNLPATTHQDVWTWEVCADLQHMGYLVDLFHELPVGSCQVPLINGEDLYQSLVDAIEALEQMSPSDPEMAEAFNSFILLLEDSCLTVECGSCDSALGIRNTTENPACCKLLADADFIIDALEVNIPSK